MEANIGQAHTPFGQRSSNQNAERANPLWCTALHNGNGRSSQDGNERRLFEVKNWVFSWADQNDKKRSLKLTWKYAKFAGLNSYGPIFPGPQVRGCRASRTAHTRSQAICTLDSSWIGQTVSPLWEWREFISIPHSPKKHFPKFHLLRPSSSTSNSKWGRLMVGGCLPLQRQKAVFRRQPNSSSTYLVVVVVPFCAFPGRRLTRLWAENGYRIHSVRN